MRLVWVELHRDPYALAVYSLNMNTPDIPVRELLSRLPVDTSHSFQGDPEATLNGMTIRFGGRRLQGRFVMLVTPEWGEGLALKYGPASLVEAVSTALDNGVTGFVLPKRLQGSEFLEGSNYIFVDNTLTFTFQLLEAMKAYRGSRRLTAVTGSAGKSTTKAMITHALSSIMPRRRIYSPGHTQNVMTSMVRHLSVTHRYHHSVIEVAGSCFVSFESLDDFTVSPDVSVITSISEAHLDYLGDLEGVARLKSQLFNAPPPGGTAIINLDAIHSDYLVRRAVEEGCQLVTYGESPDATIRLIDYNPQTGQTTAQVGREQLQYVVGPKGKHMALNSLAVIAVLRAHRIKQWREGVKSLATFSALSGRGRTSTPTLQSGATVTLLDEAYNANPASMQVALESLAGQHVEPGAKRVAVLGDMLELGPATTEIHVGLGEYLRRTRPDVVHLYGPEMRTLFHSVAPGLPGVRHWEDLDTLTQHLQETLGQGDCVLVKSANGTGLHNVVSELAPMDQRLDA